MTIKANVIDKFENLLEYRAWVNDRMGRLRHANTKFRDWFDLWGVQATIRNNGESWFGNGATAEEIVAGITEYKEPELLDKLMQKVQDAIPRGTSDQIKLRRIEFNDRGMGLFSFDRAAMGLYRVKELYSHSQERTVEREECESKEGNWVLIADQTAVTERWEQHRDGSPKVRTSTKKVFAWFPKRNKEREAVEIYVGCGGNAYLSAEQILYSGLGAIIFAQMLELARIPTKITIVEGTFHDDMESAYLALIPVKNYDQPLDTNLLATLSSDPRFFRHEGFKGIVSLFDHFGRTCPISLGSTLGREGIIRCIEQSSYTKGAKLASNRFYFGGTYSESEAVSQIKQAIGILATKLNA